MSIKTIPLSQLEADPRGTLNECADSGEAVVVELPDQRFVALQPLEATDDDSLTSDLLESNAAFQGPSQRAGSASGKQRVRGARAADGKPRERG